MPTVCYTGTAGSGCTWAGHSYAHSDLEALADELDERALDLAHSVFVEEHMRDLATTGAAVEWLESFFADAAEPDVLDWQVGEAMAEVIIEQEQGVVLPWNTRRDERIPRASLPGADLVGLAEVEGEWRLAFGEVKSSSDVSCPPQVVTGKSGMEKQLERLLESASVQLKLIKWLSARVKAAHLSTEFDEALALFVASEGSGMSLLGVLVRDTPPDEADLRARAGTLSGRLRDGTALTLIAVYMPLPMSDWPALVAA